MQRLEWSALIGSVFLLVLLTPVKSLAQSVRTVEADDIKVVGINAALGFSTILEFQAKPISAVLGDQDSFKLEYVGNSITIKPIVSRAKSNLFIFTEFDRFNCQIATGPPGQVDYIVRIRRKQKAVPGDTAIGSGSLVSPEAGQSLLTSPIHRKASYDGFTLLVNSVSRERDPSSPRSVTLIDFTLSSKFKAYPFQPGSVGVKQLGRYLALESIYLDRLGLAPGGPAIQGKIALLSQDFDSKKPVVLIFAVPSRKHPADPYRIEVSTAKASPIKSGKKDGKPNEKGK